MGWASDTGRRRRLVSQALLLVILLVQAALSLRLANAAFEDEALYVYAGHVEIGHLFYGQIEYGGFGSYFSGAPTLYPVLAAAVDSLFGLAGVRAMSLLFMLVATACLYGLTRRLFNERAARARPPCSRCPCRRSSSATSPPTTRWPSAYSP